MRDEQKLLSQRPCKACGDRGQIVDTVELFSHCNSIGCRVNCVLCKTLQCARWAQWEGTPSLPREILEQ